MKMSPGMNISGRSLRFLQTLTEIRRNNETSPATAPTISAIAAGRSPSQAADKVLIDVERTSSLSSINFKSNNRQMNSKTPSVATNFLQGAPGDRSSLSDNTNITFHPEGIQEVNLISRSEPTHSTKRTEQPEIKQEEEASNLYGVVRHGKQAFGGKDPRPTKESQTVSPEVPNNGNQVPIKDSHITTQEIQVGTKQNHIANHQGHATAENPVTNKDEQARPPSAEVLAAYKCLFRTYYGKTPIIDNKDINVSLRQLEAVIRVAELYGSVPVVGPHLGNCLLQFGQHVHEAILKDPPRWLQLSLYLKNGPIFKEAAVHIIGNLGFWPWCTVQLKDFPDDLIAILRNKFDDLKRLIADVERTLFMISIDVEGEEALLAPTDKKRIITWHVVQLWKQWFTCSVSQDEAPKPTGRADGTKYRTIAKGGDAYLPLETVMSHIKAFREPTHLTEVDKQDIEEDLMLLKSFAQKQVQVLCVNNSMLSVENTGIEHLTCASIDDVDISWVNEDVPGVGG
jgi:hypothetical protein